MSKNKNFQCIFCQSEDLEFQNWFKNLLRVTSDSKPFPKGGALSICKNCGLIQKNKSKKLINEITKIYKNYSQYTEFDGKEQMSLSEKSVVLKNRSELIVNEIKKYIKDPRNILDFGCGNGVTLEKLSNAFKKSKLFGFEINSNNEVRLGKIKNFKKLYVKDIKKINIKIDLITLIHTLEHLQEPTKILREIHNLLNTNGKLFIQVCNIEENPFDLIIADHITHFNKNTLENLLKYNGFNIIFSKNDLVKKEISILALKSDKLSKYDLVSNIEKYKNRDSYNINKKILVKQKLFFNKIDRNISQIKKTNLVIGIFGTSIGGTWLAKTLKGKFHFFIDEDKNRIGKFLMNKKIISPKEIPQKSLIFIPMAKVISSIIYKKIYRKDLTIF